MKGRVIVNDKLRNALVAISSMIPTVGGTISFLLDKYIPSESEIRKNVFLQQIANDLENLKEKIDINNIETPEFQSVFSKLLRASIEEHREEKIIAFRNITVNLLLEPNKLAFNKVEFYTRLVLLLIPDEIKILHTFFLLDIKKTLTSYDSSNKKRDIYKIIEEIWQTKDKEYVKALIIDCSRYMLISGSPEQAELHLRSGIFLTNLGEGFVNYIFKPIEVDYFGK